MSSLAIILPVVGTLVAASIAGGVAIYLKQIDRWSAAELRHSEAREKAYEAYLAACDRAWHLRVKANVDSYKHRDPLPEHKTQLIAEAINRQALGAIEDLKRNSRNFEKAAPVLARLFYEALERPSAKPSNFEAARIVFQELQREEAGLRKQLGHTRKASFREELRMRREVREKLRNVTTLVAVYEEGKDEVIIHQGDGEGIWYLLEQNMREWDELEQSVALQESRALRWKDMGLWPD